MFSVVVNMEKNGMIDGYKKVRDFPITTFLFFSFWEGLYMFYYYNKNN